MVDSKGKLLANAQVGVSTTYNSLHFNNGKIENLSRRGADPIVITGSDGKFTVNIPDSPSIIAVAHTEGYSQISNFKNGQKITLASWGTIKGDFRIGKKPGAYEEIKVTYLSMSKPGQPFIFKKGSTQTDKTGHYRLENVTAGIAWVGRSCKLTTSIMEAFTQMRFIEVKAGQTTRANLGGEGRAVVGFIRIPNDVNSLIDWSQISASLATDVGNNKQPPKDLNPDQKREWLMARFNSEEGKKERLRQQEYDFAIEQDGSFRIEDVVPGNYKLTVRFIRKKPGAFENLGTVSQKVILPKSKVELSPMDLGAIPLILQEKELDVGDSIPDFEAHLLDGAALGRNDLRGKLVLLHFWKASYISKQSELDLLTEIHTAFNNDPRFLMISFGLNEDRKEFDFFLDKLKPEWSQVYLGDLAKSSMTQTFKVHDSPSIFLVGPDGKIIKKTCWPNGLKSWIAKALVDLDSKP